MPDVSVWRNILITNEWCEMQSERHTDVDFTLMFVLFFLEVFGFRLRIHPSLLLTFLFRSLKP
jgi:hypothetical protein